MPPLPLIEIVWKNESREMPMAIIERSDEESGRCHLVKKPHPESQNVILVKVLGDDKYQLVDPHNIQESGIDDEGVGMTVPIIQDMEVVMSTPSFVQLANYYIAEWAENPEQEKEQFMAES